LRRCTRGPAPPALAQHGAAWSKEYADRRAIDSKVRFSWPTFEGQRADRSIREALGDMTKRHCSYCDGFPLDAVGFETIDHFKPKSWPEFWELAFAWENLFLCCPQCQNNKLAQYCTELLRPDEPGYDFDRYFVYHSHRGELEANPAASEEDQNRARRSIDVFGLNKSGRCDDRCRQLRYYRLDAEQGGEVDLADWAYRFLIESFLRSA
jgi:uncharacterized protein (TIGR02646 family)